MKYCCIAMQEADQDEAIDYCEPNLTTIDAKGNAYPINWCPFCGKKLVGSIKAQKEILKSIKDMKEGRVVTGTIEDLKRDTA